MVKTGAQRIAAYRERKKKKLIRLDVWIESKLYKQLIELIDNYKG